MAKECINCKQSYPDYEDHCPHCAVSVKLVDETLLAQQTPSGIHPAKPLAAPPVPITPAPTVSSNSRVLLAASVEDEPPVAKPVLPVATLVKTGQAPPNLPQAIPVGAAVPLATPAVAAPVTGMTQGPAAPRRRESEVDFDMPLPVPEIVDADVVPLGPEALVTDSDVLSTAPITASRPSDVKLASPAPQARASVLDVDTSPGAELLGLKPSPSPYSQPSILDVDTSPGGEASRVVAPPAADIPPSEPAFKPTFDATHIKATAANQIPEPPVSPVESSQPATPAAEARASILDVDTSPTVDQPAPAVVEPIPLLEEQPPPPIPLTEFPVMGLDQPEDQPIKASSADEVTEPTPIEALPVAEPQIEAKPVAEQAEPLSLEPGPEIELAELPAESPAAGSASDVALQLWEDQAQEVSVSPVGPPSPAPIAQVVAEAAPAELMGEVVVAEPAAEIGVAEELLEAPVEASDLGQQVLEAQAADASAEPIGSKPVSKIVTAAAAPGWVEEVVAAEPAFDVSLVEPVAEPAPDAPVQALAEVATPIELAGPSAPAEMAEPVSGFVTPAPGPASAEEEAIVVAKTDSSINLREPAAEVVAEPASGVPLEAWEDSSMAVAPTPESKLLPPRPASGLAATPLPQAADDASGMDFLGAVEMEQAAAKPTPDDQQGGVLKLAADAESAALAELLGAEVPPVSAEPLKAGHIAAFAEIPEKDRAAGAVGLPDTPAPPPPTPPDLLAPVAADAAGLVAASGQVDESASSASAEAEQIEAVDLEAVEAMDAAPVGAVDLEAAARTDADDIEGIDLSTLEHLNAAAAPGLVAAPPKNKASKLPSKLGLVQGPAAPASSGDEAVDLADLSGPVTAEEAEEAEELDEDEEDEDQLAKPKYGRRWLAGGVLGCVLGAATVSGLWMFGVLPEEYNPVPHEWRLGGHTSIPPQHDPTGPTTPRPPTGHLGTTDLQAALVNLNNGDFADALQVLEKPGDEPERLGARGEATWLEYRRQCSEKKAELSKEDEKVKQATKDLEAAAAQTNNVAVAAQAHYYLGEIAEAFGDRARAKELYLKGLAISNLPAPQKLLLESALNRLAIKEAEQNPAGAQLNRAKDCGLQSPILFANLTTVLERAEPDTAQASMLALFVVGLQPPGPPPVPPPPPGGLPATPPAAPPAHPAAPPSEAGVIFWNAVRLAQQHKYKEALEELKKARDEHERLRFTRLRKAQNPISDPTEEIFLRCCDEMRSYWEMRHQLQQKGYDIAKLGGPVKAMQTALDESKATKEYEAKLAALNTKLAEAGIKEANAFIGAEKLLEAKKTIEDKLKELNKTLEAAGIKEADAFLATEKLLREKKAIEDRINELNKKLAAAGVKADDPFKGFDQLVESKKALDDKLKELLAKLVGVGVKEAELAKGIDKLVDEKKAADAAVAEIVKKLIDAKLLFPNADRAELLRGVQRLIDAANNLDPQGRMVALMAELQKEKDARAEDNKKYQKDMDDLGKQHKEELAKEKQRHKEELAKETERFQAMLETETRRYKEILGQRHTPQEMLPLWDKVLRERHRKDFAVKAIRDADLVDKETDANPVVKAEAKSIRGLALRNLGQFQEALGTLKQALENAGGQEEDWQIHARRVIRELSDPANYYWPQSEELQGAGQYQAALELLNEGMRAFDREYQGKFLARRSLVWLDLARDRARGARLTRRDIGMANADKDASDAIKLGAVAEGNYAAGRIAEELGRWAEARDAYRRALAAHPLADRDGSLYRVALARVLLRLQQEARPGGDRIGQAPADNRNFSAGALAGTGKWSAEKDDQQGALETLATLVLLVGVDGLPCPPAGPIEGPAAEEALRLADEVLQSKDADFVARSQAWAIKGMWTKALQVYVEGLQPHLRRDHAEGLMRLMACHPAFRRPEALTIPNPLEAEKYYAIALQLLESCRYKEAEGALIEAIRNDCQDARYFYFLGLSRLAQHRADEAYADFEEGYKLEQENKPGREAVSRALERVQGPARQVLNKFRK